MNQIREYIRLLLREYKTKVKNKAKVKPYTLDVLEDESVHGTSVLVPDDIKKKIFDYFINMGLSKRKF